MSKPWPIVFMGTPRTAAMTLERLIEGPDPVVGVVTQPSRPAGRGQKTAPSPVSDVAKKRGIPIVAPEKIRDPGFLVTLQNWHPQIVVVVAFGRILPTSILNLAPQGCLNVHYSLLPRYRGAAPAAWTIINGEKNGGVTTMKLVEKMDAGPIYLQKEIDLAHDEAGVTLAPMIKKEEGLIDWSQPALVIERRVRGFNPWPSAYTHLRGMLLKVHRAGVV